MNTTAIQMNGRTYTFTTEGAEERGALNTIGSLQNSRGDFAGYVVRLNRTGTLSLIGGPRVNAHEVRRALAVLDA